MKLSILNPQHDENVWYHDDFLNLQGNIKFLFMYILLRPMKDDIVVSWLLFDRVTKLNLTAFPSFTLFFLIEKKEDPVYFYHLFSFLMKTNGRIIFK